MMKEVLRCLVCILLILVCAGCVRGKSAHKAGVKPVPTPLASPLPPYSGSRASVVVADFEVSAVKAHGEISAAIKEMLIAALNDSKRFSVVEPSSLSGEPLQRIDSNLPVIKNADVIIFGAISDFEPQSSGGSGGVGGGGGSNSGAFGGLMGRGLNQARLALEIRIVNASTTQIIAKTKVEGQASDMEGAIVGSGAQTWELSGGLSLYANTPMGKAIRVCIVEAVKYISGNIPAEFYKY